MQIPDYLIYDEIKRRERKRDEGGLKPLHLPLYRPEPEEHPHEDEESEESTPRGVVIIDMNSGIEIAD